MIIYIHGFGGSGEGSKAKAFREYFKSIDEPFIAPSLSYVPELAIRTLEEMIESYHGDLCLIGSSLGGYYTMYLAQKYNLKAVLINPAIHPDQTLRRSLGNAPNYYDESYYNWNDTHLAMLQTYKTQIAYQKNFKLLLQMGDELLNYNEALNYLPNAYKTVEKGGSHSFEGIERHFESIREFFAVGNYFKHTMKVKGVGFKLSELANRTGDLYYDSLSSFLTYLSWKLDKDAQADRERGRKKLALLLHETAQQIKKSSGTMRDAFNIVKPHIYKWEIDHGSNRNGLHFESKILDTPDRAQCQIWVSDIHITNLVIIDEIKEDGSISRPTSDSYWGILDFKGNEVNYRRNNFVDDRLFTLFDEEDKQRLDKFIPMLNEHINSLEINQKFTYVKGYSEEEDDVEMNFMHFRETYIQNGWKETILGSTGERQWTHVILRISKDNKLFQYTTYANMLGDFVVAKYNNDCKDFIENVLFKALLGDKSHDKIR
ncbi:YqiA/YcfP family alpha/beta fold hydrolase [Sulfuricurvum sp.]|uniref:YqiA/YcfP family alpha/beta fold hydrolase n=1 Tax=Sulfuricurvum sp. TaxID=2025608 RepID=UPI00344ED1FD